MLLLRLAAAGVFGCVVQASQAGTGAEGSAADADVDADAADGAPSEDLQLFSQMAASGAEMAMLLQRWMHNESVRAFVLEEVKAKLERLEDAKEAMGEGLQSFEENSQWSYAADTALQNSSESPFCKDSEDGASDGANRSCWHYSENPRGCNVLGILEARGVFDYEAIEEDDDDDFTSADMCCACGGGDMPEEEEYAPSELWESVSGDCIVDGDCIRSPNWPATYASEQACEIKIKHPDPTDPVHFLAAREWPGRFATEDVFDVLTMNGRPYSGETGPQADAGGGVVPTGAISWTSDSSRNAGGWEFCVKKCEVGERIVDKSEDYPLLNQNGQKVLTCEACPKGKFGNETGSWECYDCPAGKYSDKEMSTNCAVCAAGRASSDVARPKNCDECDLGRYAEEDQMTECNYCRDPWQADFEYWTTLRSNPDGSYSEMWGSTSPNTCGCTKDDYERKGSFRPPQGESCDACAEGMICTGMGDFKIMQGYFSRADTPTFIWRCHEDFKFNRCPGGEPGKCGDNRLNESLACLQCEADMVPNLDGGCTKCQAQGYTLIVVFCTCVVIGEAAVYHTIASENRAKDDSASAMMIVAMSILVTTVQVMGILDSMQVPWPAPFGEWLNYIEVFTFGLTALGVGCVLPQSPLVTYSLKLLCLVAMATVMVVIHFLHVIIFHEGNFRRRMSALIGSVGIIFMAFFISIAKTIFTPWQCEPHPNGLWTMESNKDVVCFKSDFYAETVPIHSVHLDITYIAAGAALVPVSFLALTAWVVKELPKRVHRGDTKFLHRYYFLFFRLRPERYWYILVQVTRNFLMAVVPVIPMAFIQVIAVAFLVMSTTFITPMFSPWRVGVGNILDIGSNFCLLFVLILAGFIVPAVDDETVGVACCIIGGTLFAGFAGTGLVAGYLHVRVNLQKQYSYFFNFDTQGGAFARLLYTCLAKKLGKEAKNKIFFDPNTMLDLQRVFSCVVDSSNMVGICASRTFRRPWCVSQVAAARSIGTEVVLLLLPGFVMPDPNDAEAYVRSTPGIDELAPYGISAADVVMTIQWLPECPYTIEIDDMVCMTYVEGLISSIRLAGSSGEKIQQVPIEDCMDPPCPPTANPLIVMDIDNFEARATAFVLREMLAQHLQTRGVTQCTPHVWQHYENLPKTTTKAFIICSYNCLNTDFVIDIMTRLEQQGAAMVPVIVDEHFELPSKSEPMVENGISNNILEDEYDEVDGVYLKIEKSEDSDDLEGDLKGGDETESTMIPFDKSGTSSTLGSRTTINEIIDELFSGTIIHFYPWERDKIVNVQLLSAINFWALSRTNILEGAPVLLAPTISHTANVRDVRGARCVASFPGSYAELWQAAQSQNSKEWEQASVACVFLRDETDGFGVHVSTEECAGKCWCRQLYGDRDFRTMGWLTKIPYGLPQEEQEQMRTRLESLRVEVVLPGDAPETKVQKEELARMKWETAGRTAVWGCKWFADWKESVDRAYALSQKLQVYFYPGEHNMGMHSWEELSKEEVDLWDGTGLGASQKVEVAYLRQQQYPFVALDVEEFRAEFARNFKLPDSF